MTDPPQAHPARVGSDDAFTTALAFCRFVQWRDDVPAAVKGTAADVEEELRAALVEKGSTDPAIGKSEDGRQAIGSATETSLSSSVAVIPPGAPTP